MKGPREDAELFRREAQRLYDTAAVLVAYNSPVNTRDVAKILHGLGRVMDALAIIREQQ